MICQLTSVINLQKRKRRRHRDHPSSLVINLVSDVKPKEYQLESKSVISLPSDENQSPPTIQEALPTENIENIKVQSHSSFMSHSRHLTLERGAVSTLDVCPLTGHNGI